MSFFGLFKSGSLQLSSFSCKNRLPATHHWPPGTVRVLRPRKSAFARNHMPHLGLGRKRHLFAVASFRIAHHPGISDVSAMGIAGRLTFEADG